MSLQLENDVTVISMKYIPRLLHQEYAQRNHQKANGLLE